MTNRVDPQRIESLGPAERILQMLLTHSDHLVHNRPGMVCQNRTAPHGVCWYPVTHKAGVVYRLDKQGRKSIRTRVGLLGEDNVVRDGRQVVGSYRTPGLFPEVAAWMYKNIADVWQMDNEFAAHWASWALTQEHRDLKVALAAFMLVQERCGAPVVDDGEVLFFDDDHRAVGEAMCLLRRRDNKDLSPRLLLRVGDLLALPEVAAINRELGFGRSARSVPMGRYPKAVTKWLRHREQNPRMLQGLVRAGYRTTVMRLARRVGYKPLSSKFFQILRWKQKQANDGRRSIGIGDAVAQAESWQDLSEAQICQRIVDTKPSFKRLCGLIPQELGLTRAILAAAIESRCLSNAELVILTPTIEDLGLLDVPAIRDRWVAASEAAENRRAAHIAERVRDRKTAEKLRESADRAVQKAMVEATRGMRVYVAVDISASMQGAIDKAKGYLSEFLHGFPLDKLHVAVFNTRGTEVKIRHASAKGVAHAFRGFKAGGGTNHGSAIRDVFINQPAQPDEDVLFLFVGDQQQYGSFTEAVRESGLNPVAFGFLYVPGSMRSTNRAVELTAENLGVPCFRIDEGMFGDAYAVTRTFRHLIESTPVGKRSNQQGNKRAALIETILSTPLLTKPIWA